MVKINKGKEVKKMKRINILIVVLLIFCLAFMTSLAKESWNFSIGTSALGGTYYTFGVPWAKIISEKVPDAVATIQATGGPGNNMQLIEKGEMKLAYVSAAAGYQGWTGTGWADGKKYNEVRALFATYPSYFEMVTLNKYPIKNIRDLEGKRVHVSLPGATPNIVMLICLEVLNIKPKVEIPLQSGNAKDLLKDGKLDVWIATYGLPSSMIMDLQSTTDIRLVDILPEDIKAVNAKYPFCVPSKIPAGMYENQPNGINTFVFWNFAIADKDLPDELVYNIVKAVFENKHEFVAAHASGKYVAPENIINSPIPLHPGAIKYYREIGIEIPEDLVP